VVKAGCDIAATAAGGHLLTLGLISHGAALLGGLVAASGSDRFFAIVFPLAGLALAWGAWLEIQAGGRRPWASARFYVAALLAFLPLLGPLLLLGSLFGWRHGGLAGFLPAMGRLHAGAWSLGLLVAALLLLFVLLQSRTDPYFLRRQQALPSVPTLVPTSPREGLPLWPPC
jgi:hypothetical protein